MKLKTEKERIYAMADAFTASMLMVVTKESPIYIGDENLHMTEDGKVSRHEVLGAMSLAITEFLDRTGLGGEPRRPTSVVELLNMMTRTVVDMVSESRAEMVKEEMGVPPGKDRERKPEMPIIFNTENHKPN